MNIAEDIAKAPKEPWAVFRTWLFRECNEGTRRHLWAMFGLPVHEVRNHGDEAHCLRYVRRRLLAASARIKGDKDRDNPVERPHPPYNFDRYVGGKLMAEGITIEREGALDAAIARAVQLCPKANAPTVLVLVERLSG